MISVLEFEMRLLHDGNQNVMDFFLLLLVSEKINPKDKIHKERYNPQRRIIHTIRIIKLNNYTYIYTVMYSES